MNRISGEGIRIAREKWEWIHGKLSLVGDHAIFTPDNGQLSQLYYCQVADIADGMMNIVGIQLIESRRFGQTWVITIWENDHA